MRASSPTRSAQRERQRGTVAAEFALVLPILIGLMFGMIDAGRFIATRTMLSQAAAAGARAACLSGASGATIDTAVHDAAAGLSSISVASVQCNPPLGGGACTYPVAANTVVAVTVQYTFIVGFFRAFQKDMQNLGRVVC